MKARVVGIYGLHLSFILSSSEEVSKSKARRRGLALWELLGFGVWPSGLAVDAG